MAVLLDYRKQPICINFQYHLVTKSELNRKNIRIFDTKMLNKFVSFNVYRCDALRAFFRPGFYDSFIRGCDVLISQQL